jgi:tetratricopeptide (TPR) repeat protein
LHYSRALLHWARALGAARSGKTAQAMRDAEAVRQLRDQLASLEGRRPFLSETEVLVRQAEGWYAFADGRKDEAAALLREAADLEDSFEKHPITPGAAVPAREMLAELLLELKRPQEALAEFEASLRSTPRRFNGVYGAARAAQMAGDKQKAGRYFAQLVEIGGEGEAERAELREARAYVEQQRAARATASR